MDTKYCKKCDTTKPVSEFWKNRGAKDGLQAYCKPCTSAQVNGRLKGPDRERVLRINRNSRFKRVYGITHDEYDEMLAWQRGRCWICQEPPSDDRRLAVDHDHACCPGEKSCGKCIRGLLCRRCNQAIGLFKENVDLIRWAATYVERSAMARPRRAS
jgi:hypothetical protein